MYLRNPHRWWVLFILFSRHIQSMSSRRCKALCIIINFLVIWILCPHSFFVHFRNGPEYLMLYIPLTLFERVVCERELETEQNCNILTPTLLSITAFLSRSSGLLNWRPGGPASLGAGFLYLILSPTTTAQSGTWGPTLLGAGFLYRILCPTYWTSCPLSYIIVHHPPSSCGRHKSHTFNPSTVKVIFWYSSTGCTCYLHRCLSYFDSPAGSEVNIQHLTRKTIRVFILLMRFLLQSFVSRSFLVLLE